MVNFFRMTMHNTRTDSKWQKAADHFHDRLFPRNAANQLGDIKAKLSCRRCIAHCVSPQVEITSRGLIISITFIVIRRTVTRILLRRTTAAAATAAWQVRQVDLIAATQSRATLTNVLFWGNLRWILWFACGVSCDIAQRPHARSLVFKCDLDHAKHSFYQAANRIFGKIGKLQLKPSSSQLIMNKCVPVLLYVLEACPLNNSQVLSLDLVVHRLFYETV